MDHDFLDGIDEAFQRLMKLNANGKRNGRSIGRSGEDTYIWEIVDHLGKLPSSQKQEVLNFVLSLEKQK